MSCKLFWNILGQNVFAVLPISSKTVEEILIIIED
jgi:hypothetical protein